MRDRAGGTPQRTVQELALEATQLVVPYALASSMSGEMASVDGDAGIGPARGRRRREREYGVPR